jgi:hypothetical protein
MAYSSVGQSAVLADELSSLLPEPSARGQPAVTGVHHRAGSRGPFSASGKILWSHDGWLSVPALTAAVKHAVNP